MNTPTISTTFDLEADRWLLTATSYGKTEPAGPRLFRAGPHPDIQFSHDTQESAERDAAELRAYLEAVSQKRAPSKAKLRRMSAD